MQCLVCTKTYNLSVVLQKSFLPKLTKLNASNNNLTKLDKDFHGLPALCVVDLSHNRIASISPNLVDKTRCISHTVVTKMDIMLQGKKSDNINNYLVKH